LYYQLRLRPDPDQTTYRGGECEDKHSYIIGTKNTSFIIILEGSIAELESLATEEGQKALFQMPNKVIGDPVARVR